MIAPNRDPLKPSVTRQDSDARVNGVRASRLDTIATPLVLDDVSLAGYAGHTVVSRIAPITFGVICLILGVTTPIALTTRIAVTVDAVGIVEPATLVAVRSAMKGRVAAVLVASGDTVRRGQTLIQLDSKPGTFTLAELRTLRDEQRIRILLLKAEQPVKRAERDAMLEQAHARQLRAHGTLRLRMGDLGLLGDADSLLRVYHSGGNSMLDVAVADFRDATGEVARASAELSRGAMDALEVKRLTFEMRRSEIQVAAQRDEMSYANVVSPVDGVVLSDGVAQLQTATVQEGQTLLELSAGRRWRARLSVAEGDVRRVRIGDEVRMHIPALTMLGVDVFAGSVVAVAREPLAAMQGAVESVPISTKRYQVLVSFADTAARVPMEFARRGLTVRAEVITRRESALSLLRDWLFARRE